jgi:preprotein translocase subunit SecG
MGAFITVMTVLVFLFLIIWLLVYINDRDKKSDALKKKDLNEIL